MSVRTFCSRLMSEAWSVVMGHWVKASPAKMVNPILSSGRSAMNSAATLLAASMRLGFRSSASILVETSMASMMSMPSTVWVPHRLWVCGLAKTITTMTKVKMRNKKGSSLSLTRQLLGAY